MANADEVRRPTNDHRAEKKASDRARTLAKPVPKLEKAEPRTHPRNVKTDLRVVSRNFH